MIVKIDAFEAESFKNLVSIKFTNELSPLHFENDCFRGLNRLRNLFIQLSSVITIDTRFLQAVSKSITVIFLENFICNIGFRDIFGNVKYPKQIMVFIENFNSNKFVVLAPGNFTRLMVMKSLYIINCGIEIILQGTFDEISDSLQEVGLTENRIKQISVSLFKSLFESTSFIEWYARGFIVEDNFLNCNCELTLIENFNRIHISNRIFPCIAENQTKNIDKNCPGLQRFKISMFCGEFTRNFKYFIYNNFNIKLNERENSVVIQTKVNDSFRVLLDSLGQRQICPNNREINDTIKCIQLTANHLQIPQSMMPQSAFIKVSIIYYIHGWPLSTVTIRLLDQTNIWWSSTQFLSMSVVIGFCIIGFLVGFLAQTKLLFLLYDLSYNKALITNRRFNRNISNAVDEHIVQSTRDSTSLIDYLTISDDSVYNAYEIVL